VRFFRGIGSPSKRYRLLFIDDTDFSSLPKTYKEIKVQHFALGLA
jgi:hypothetical protein